MLNYTILYYTILYYTILYYTILYSTLLYSTILYYTLLYYTILYYTILYSTLLYSTLLYSTLLYSTLLYYTILYYTILYYTILYYTILYYTILHYIHSAVDSSIVYIQKNDRLKYRYLSYGLITRAGLTRFAEMTFSQVLHEASHPGQELYLASTVCVPLYHLKRKRTISGRWAGLFWAIFFAILVSQAGLVNAITILSPVVM